MNLCYNLTTYNQICVSLFAAIPLYKSGGRFINHGSAIQLKELVRNGNKTVYRKSVL